MVFPHTFLEEDQSSERGYLPKVSNPDKRKKERKKEERRRKKERKKEDKRKIIQNHDKRVLANARAKLTRKKTFIEWVNVGNLV